MKEASLYFSDTDSTGLLGTNPIAKNLIRLKLHTQSDLTKIKTRPHCMLL